MTKHYHHHEKLTAEKACSDRSWIQTWRCFVLSPESVNRPVVNQYRTASKHNVHKQQSFNFNRKQTSTTLDQLWISNNDRWLYWFNCVSMIRSALQHTIPHIQKHYKTFVEVPSSLLNSKTGSDGVTEDTAVMQHYKYTGKQSSPLVSLQQWPIKRGYIEAISGFT